MNKNRLIIRDYRSVEGIFTGMAIDKALKQTERKFTLKVTQNDYVEGNHKLYEVYRKSGKRNWIISGI